MTMRPKHDPNHPLLVAYRRSHAPVQGRPAPAMPVDEIEQQVLGAAAPRVSPAKLQRAFALSPVLEAMWKRNRAMKAAADLMRRHSNEVKNRRGS
jgi:hypothetical protein